jgi:hypothetical protein
MTSTYDCLRNGDPHLDFSDSCPGSKDPQTPVSKDFEGLMGA